VRLYVGRTDPGPEIRIRQTSRTRWRAEIAPGVVIRVERGAVGGVNRLLRATLVHLWFVWVHPFPDGNGRVARFLMNTALLAGRLPWLTIRVDQRDAYVTALRRAQLERDHAAFARFIARSYRDSFAGGSGTA